MLNRKLIYIIFASFIFSGELEVDGDLTVTGNIQNQTIDSLLQVIADLQSQITSMQGVSNIYETREYTIPVNFTDFNQSHNIDFLELTGHNLEYAIVRLLDAEYISGTGDTNIQIFSAIQSIYFDVKTDGSFVITNNQHQLMYSNNFRWDYASSTYDNLYNNNLYIKNSSPVEATITISVTAQFPN
tara:strand:+ start:1105 stop:1662 length:558 start_codon:yes stop_codon:yes gene_type:complete